MKILMAALVFLMSGVLTAAGQEHENTGYQEGMDSPAHGGGSLPDDFAQVNAEPAQDAWNSGGSINDQDILSAVRLFIEEDMDIEDGYFDVYDEVTEEIRSLAFQVLHETVRKKGDSFHVCADFKDIHSEEILDVDFFVEHFGGAAEVMDVRIHKVDGEERFTYGGERAAENLQENSKGKGADSLATEEKNTGPLIEGGEK